jgi:hypothetical protein
MEIRVNLEEIWSSSEDYSTTIANIIRQELDTAIRSEVRSLIRKKVKDDMLSLSKTISGYLKNNSAEKLKKALAVLEAE